MKYDQVIKFYGGVSQTARALGYTRPAIYHWRDHGISLRTQKIIEAITGGKLKQSKKGLTGKP
jgi:hypothetical protein